MSRIASATVPLFANDAPLQSALRRNGESLRQWGRDADRTIGRVGNNFGGLASRLRSLNDLGKGLGLSADSGIVGLLKGAGIAAAVKFTADAVRDGAKAWGEYRQGLIGAEELTIRLIKAIPILGSVVEAAQAVKDAANAKEIANQKQLATEFDKEFQRREKETNKFEEMKRFANEFTIGASKDSKLLADRRAIDEQLEKIRAFEFGEKMKGVRLNRAQADFFRANPQKPLNMSVEQRAAIMEADKANAAAFRKVSTEFFAGVTNLGTALKDGLTGAGRKFIDTIGKGIDSAGEEARKDFMLGLGDRIRFTIWRSHLGGDQTAELKPARPARTEIFAAHFEGLQDMFRRVQGAAASSNPAIEAAQQAADAADRGANETAQMRTALNEVKKTAGDLLTGLKTLIQMNPWASRFQ